MDSAIQPNLSHSTLCLTSISVNILVYISLSETSNIISSNKGKQWQRWYADIKKRQQRHSSSSHKFQCPLEPHHRREYINDDQHCQRNGPPPLTRTTTNRSRQRQRKGNSGGISYPRPPEGGKSMKSPPLSITPTSSWTSSRNLLFSW